VKFYSETKWYVGRKSSGNVCLDGRTGLSFEAYKTSSIQVILQTKYGGGTLLPEGCTKVFVKEIGEEHSDGMCV
jgi:hypothetical protein